MYRNDDVIVYSPSDLITYLASPFASWMDHYYLLNKGLVAPDEDAADKKMVAAKGYEHEARILTQLRTTYPQMVEIPNKDAEHARVLTLEALQGEADAIYQAYLTHESFSGWSDFIMLGQDGRYEVWDTKLARKAKPYYAVQLCCYAEMLDHSIGADRVSETVGVILGTGERVAFRRTDFDDYYRQLKARFLAMHEQFRNDLSDRPEPVPRADHGRWSSYAESYFLERDHLVQVAGITTGNIKKLHDAGVHTVEQLAEVQVDAVPTIAAETLDRLVQQAALQVATRTVRQHDASAKPVFTVIKPTSHTTTPQGLAKLPVFNEADVYFDLEGFPLVEGGLEYLWGACYHEHGSLQFKDWWAHDSDEERRAFEDFIDWVYARWKASAGMHIYHYAAYELSVIRRLSTRYATRQDEVDDLLRNDVFVDLYRVVVQSIRLGEDSYSIKRVERLYRDTANRQTDVGTAGESIVQYARWLDEDAEERRTWQESAILKGIRDYNEDDCRSTYELVSWLRDLADQHAIGLYQGSYQVPDDAQDDARSDAQARAQQRRYVEEQLRLNTDPLSQTLADLIDFHRREAKPVWWTYFDRLNATEQELYADHACIASVSADGQPVPVARSLEQRYTFDPMQECKLSGDGKKQVLFTHVPLLKATLTSLDTVQGTLTLKASQAALTKTNGGTFPSYGSLIPYEYVNADTIADALTNVCQSHLESELPAVVQSMLLRKPPTGLPKKADETTVQAALRVVSGMHGDCLIIQGPPGTGKTYTAATVISSLLKQGKRIGIASNSHKAIMNLVRACGNDLHLHLYGCKVGGDETDELFSEHPDLQYVSTGADAIKKYKGGILAGTAWLFTRDEWVGQLDYLFIDEAGQVSLANAVAMARCTRNVILMGDQMQLEQPIQGSHPGDARLSVLQYYLKDLERSRPNYPVFHAVVSEDAGLFLGESRRMHPSICKVVSDLAYAGRLKAHEQCAMQRVLPIPGSMHIIKEHGIIFSGVEHYGNVQSSQEEVERILSITDELLGNQYIDKHGAACTITMDDILYITPYNAQVRALRDALGSMARIGSVDKFQGQEAPITILSMCSSYGEYGSRGLSFILDANRLNVAISRAQCLAIVVGDQRICATSVTSIDEMRLVNGFCRLVNEGT